MITFVAYREKWCNMWIFRIICTTHHMNWHSIMSTRRSCITSTCVHIRRPWQRTYLAICLKVSWFGLTYHTDWIKNVFLNDECILMRGGKTSYSNKPSTISEWFFYSLQIICLVELLKKNVYEATLPLLNIQPSNAEGLCYLMSSVLLQFTSDVNYHRYVGILIVHNTDTTNSFF
jgi:hypothetical protein